MSQEPVPVVHDKLHRSTYEVLRILSASLLDKTPIKELFTKEPEYVADDGQLTLKFFVDTNELKNLTTMNEETMTPGMTGMIVNSGMKAIYALALVGAFFIAMAI